MGETLEVYIKMCREATEIQAEHKEFTERIHAHFKTLKDAQRIDNPIGGTFILAQLGSHYTMADGTWVPTQSQLQEKTAGKEGVYGHISRLWDWIMRNWGYLTITEVTIRPGIQNDHTRDRFTSGEQLELAYAMDTLYGKRWNGDQWVRP